MNDIIMPTLKTSAMQRTLLAAATIVAALLFLAQVAWTVVSSGDGPLYVAAAPVVSLERTLGEAWRTMPVQSGRIKPLGIAAGEWVRQITGREYFAGHDPLALAVDWRMRTGPQGANDAIDWEHTPVILCDWPPLREAVLSDAAAAGKGRGGEEPGRHLTPAELRGSPRFVEILRGAAQLRAEGGAKASLTMSIDEQRAEEVSRRISLFDAVRGAKSTRLAGAMIVDDKFTLLPSARPGEAPDLPGALAALRHRDPWRLLPVGDAKGEWLSLGQIERVVAGLEPLQQIGDRRLSSAEQEDFVEQLAPVAAAWSNAREAYLPRSGDDWGKIESDFPAAIAATAGRLETRASPAAETGLAYPYHPGLFALEIVLHDWRPFCWAWALMLVAAIGLGSAMIAESALLYRVAIGVYGVSLLCQIIGLTLRTIVAGRAPVASMYETVVFAAIIAGLLGLILEGIYRLQVIALAAALVTSLGLMLADQLPTALDPTIAPLVPVLRTNFWLMLHVLTIVGGYAAGTLAWGLGNLSLGLLAFGRPSPEQVKLLARFTYRGMQVTVVLLAAGTLLGGAWAAEAWGRFWGWDPKEIAALVALVVYVLPLHARLIGLVDDLGLLVSAVACFGAIILSWYVVNFLLAAGLHSYGFSSGGAGWVLAAVLLNLVWVLGCAWRLAEVSEGNQ